TRLLRALLAMAIACTAALWAVPVFAATVSATSHQVVAGGTLDVSAIGGLDSPSPFTVSVALWIGAGTPVQLTPELTHDPSGNATGVVTVPPSTPPGSYTLAVCNNPAPCLQINQPGNQPPAGTDSQAVDVTAAPTPTPTPVPTPTATPTPATTPTPHPTPKPTAAHTATPAPTPTATPTPAPTPTATPEPTALPLASVATPPPAAPPPSSRPPAGPLAYDVAAHAPAIVNLQVTAFALLSIVGGGGLAGAGMALRPAAAGGGRRSGSIASGKVKHAKYAGDRTAPGDQSLTWRWPGTALLDGLSLALPARVAPRSPLLARLLVDGAHLRAMLGSLSLLAPALGVVLGALALHDTGGHALPPQLPLLAAICALSVVDAMAGIAAALVFGAGVVLSGGLATADDLRVLLGLGGLWFAAPLIASAARPLRRPPGETGAERWDRLADLVIASLVGAWAVQKLASALPGLAGHALPVSSQTGALALVVLAALTGRFLAESLVTRLYPQRLAQVLPAKVPFASPLQRLGATAVRTGLFLLVAIPFIGSRWQLYVGAVLFVVPQVLSIFESRFPNWPGVYAVIPRGILKTVLMLFFGKAFGTLVTSHLHDPRQLIADCFVLLALPGLVLSLLDLVARDGTRRELTWLHRIGGTAVLLVGVLFVLGYVG
ncbi:MAG TPA: hypothetical protein VGL20_08100, partial [Candidatus Dormibacteraeota bacterium]